jgi:hypothetical protein
MFVNNGSQNASHFISHSCDIVGTTQLCALFHVTAPLNNFATERNWLLVAMNSVYLITAGEP